MTTGGNYLLRRQPRPAEQTLQDLRDALTKTADDLVAIEAQRFVPPTNGAAHDRYSSGLESLSQQVMWQAKIGVALALNDFIAATNQNTGDAAVARAMVSIGNLRAVLNSVPVQEWNEAAYVKEMQRLLARIEWKLMRMPEPMLTPTP